MVRIIQNRYIYCLLNFSITLKIHCLTNIASLNMHARASKISFTGAWMPSLLKPVQKNILCLEILCSSWPYKEHVSLPPPHCVPFHIPNEISYVKVNIETDSDATVSNVFSSFSDSLIATWKCHQLFLEWFRNLLLTKTKTSVLRLCHILYRKTFDILIHSCLHMSTAMATCLIVACSQTLKIQFLWNLHFEEVCM